MWVRLPPSAPELSRLPANSRKPYLLQKLSLATILTTKKFIPPYNNVVFLPTLVAARAAVNVRDPMRKLPGLVGHEAYKITTR